ncbi:hypothetical protein TorRG33x02_114630 [Trema orientale]|uniref:Uncharacterized protein n=1 Tax=Trema orientale TaxID=63057 RepID=A0A2P5F4Y8_TREOI|nr:hypothetical protein TorRG33x02_114630 [Trema orientale]
MEKRFGGAVLGGTIPHSPNKLHVVDPIRAAGGAAGQPSGPDN